MDFTFLLILIVILMQLMIASQSGPLKSTSWDLVSIDDHPLLPGTWIDLYFNDDEFRGYACNDFQGKYRQGITRLTISELVQSRMAPDEPAGALDQEFAFMVHMISANRFKLVDRQLCILSDDGGRLVFDPRDE